MVTFFGPTIIGNSILAALFTQVVQNKTSAIQCYLQLYQVDPKSSFECPGKAIFIKKTY